MLKNMLKQPFGQGTLQIWKMNQKYSEVTIVYNGEKTLLAQILGSQ